MTEQTPVTKPKKRKKIWDNCRHIKDVRISRTQLIRVELVAGKGVKYANIREWYVHQETGEWRPGLSGFKVPVLMPIGDKLETSVDGLIEALVNLLGQAEAFPLEDEANMVWTKP